MKVRIIVIQRRQEMFVLGNKRNIIGLIRLSEALGFWGSRENTGAVSGFKTKIHTQTLTTFTSSQLGGRCLFLHIGLNVWRIGGANNR